MLSTQQHIQRLTGVQSVHRLRDWEDGDTLYGVRAYNTENNYQSASGKTFTNESDARSHYEREPVLGDRDKFDVVFYAATVRDPTRESVDPNDPGEPPMKEARLEDVRILDRKPPTGN